MGPSKGVARFRGNVDGLTNLTAVLRDANGAAALQIDLFRTVRGGDVFCFRYGVNPDGVLERLSEGRFPDIDEAISRLSRDGLTVVIDKSPDR